MTTSGLAVELRGISKRFGSLQANESVSLRARKGTIHAVIGENGAGKSTAMKILYGQLGPDAGEILIDGILRRWNSPRDAIGAGIGMVHQHFMLAEPFTVLENVLLGAESTASGLGGWIDRKRARTRLQRIATENGFELDCDARVETLPVGLQQRVEILKLLYRDAQVLILDEPTAVLTPQEAQDLFRKLRGLADLGKTVLVITHKLAEVMAHSDDVTVLRAGQVVGTRRTAETSAEELGVLMVGRKVVSPRVESASAPMPRSPASLEVSGLELTLARAGRGIGPLTFTVQPGEIVGIAGVEGNGQSELIRALLHPGEFRTSSRGEIRILGSRTLGESRAYRNFKIKELGVSLVPEDRHAEGLLLGSSLEDNFLLGLQRARKFTTGLFGGWIRHPAVRSAANRALKEFDVRPPVLTQLASELSGGNQQKLIIAREFERKPGLLVAAQPTRGVDIGAIEAIHKQILAARARGAAVLLISSELEEIMNLSDRILVFYDGKIAGELSHEEAAAGGEEKIGLLMGGGR